MKIYQGVDTSQSQPPTDITSIIDGVGDIQVPNSDRLSFHGLANNHHYILQNRLFSHAPTSAVEESSKMSPTTTHTHPATTLTSTNGIKMVGNSSNSNSTGLFHSFSPCGDGDMCGWDWNMSSLSLSAMEPPSEWFSPTTDSSDKPTVKSISTSLTSLSNGSARGRRDVNGNLDHQDESLTHLGKKPFQRPASLDFINQNGNHAHNPYDEAIAISQNCNENSSNVDETESSTGSENKEEEISNKSSQYLDKRARSSSLKASKTPPGTPGHKKIVRFADCLGLDLVDVKLFLDEIPNVPKSAFSDLQDAIDRRDEELVQKKNKANKLDRTLLPSFHQPVEMGDFFDRVDAQKVLLENCYLVDSHQIKGCVRVKNLDFNKTVFLRFTYDDWESFGEIETTYVPGSCDGFSDRFEFNLVVDSARTRIGAKFAFACRYECLRQEFWDNNCGRNYVFHCVPSN